MEHLEILLNEKYWRTILELLAHFKQLLIQMLIYLLLCNDNFIFFCLDDTIIFNLVCFRCFLTFDGFPLFWSLIYVTCLILWCFYFELGDFKGCHKPIERSETEHFTQSPSSVGLQWIKLCHDLALVICHQSRIDAE